MQARNLTCEGQLVATAEVAETYGYDSDLYDNVFVFKNDSGYELLVVGRRERYDQDGMLQRALVSVDLTPAPSAAVLQEIVEARWSTTSAVWWQLLDDGRDHDEMLHELWVPERMRRDLDASSVYDKSLALRSGYYGGQELGAPGRTEERWKERAVYAAGALLSDRGWKVRPGPELSSGVEPGGILSTSTEVVGSLWAYRYGHEVALVVRVDDCGEIYSRLADPDDVVCRQPGLNPRNSGGPAPLVDDRGPERNPVPVGEALEQLLGNHSEGAAFGWGMEL
jgi:hypothetical protein